MIEPINETTYRLKMAEDEVEVGDINAAEFKPHAKLNRWGGECWLAVRPAGEIEEEVEHEVEGDKVKCKFKVKQDDIEFEWETEFYPLEPRTVITKDKDGNDVEFKQCELGGFEFEVILKEKPLTNKIILDIETQGLNFYYQPELTPEEIAEGCIRPDNVVGSFAVYHATCGNMHKGKATAEKYKCGKAFHIYRPKITDAEGNWVWGELLIDEKAGTLTTTILQEFLDSAVYPVSTGTSNFGYESMGSTYRSIEDTIKGGQFPCGGTGTATSMTAWLYVTTEAHLVKCRIYDTDGYSCGEETEEIDVGVGYAQEITFEFDAPGPSLSITDYVLVAFGEGTGGVVYLFCDATGGDGKTLLFLTYPNWPSEPVTFDAGDHLYSIYCTYEEEAVGISIPVAIHHYKMAGGL